MQASQKLEHIIRPVQEALPGIKPLLQLKEDDDADTCAGNEDGNESDAPNASTEASTEDGKYTVR